MINPLVEALAEMICQDDDWERNPVALCPDQLLNLAEALNVSVEDLVGSNRTKKRGSGQPTR